MNKTDASIIARWKRSSNEELSDVYSSWSSKKQKAWEHCKELCKKYNGERLRIISANGWQFTAGFGFVNENGEKCVMYISKCGNFEIKMED